MLRNPGGSHPKSLRRLPDRTPGSQPEKVGSTPIEGTMSELTKKAREKYQHILDGKEGHWFDPGEYEYLKQEWFNDFALRLIESLEGYEDRAMERDEYNGT